MGVQNNATTAPMHEDKSVLCILETLQAPKADTASPVELACLRTSRNKRLTPPP
jgi:hypothetical protein